jgi:murein DD-endopeptidase MepM/ murein hydrolase activator NlpD
MELGRSNSREMICGRRIGVCAVVCLTVWAVAGAGVLAQSKKTVTRNPTGLNWLVKDCGQGVELRLGANEERQGSLAMVRVTSKRPLQEVKGERNGNATPIWHATLSKLADGDHWEGLLGIDLEQEVGEHEFELTEKESGQEPVVCRASVTVKDGKFATEKLNVAPQFVEPNPEQLARAQEESKRLHEIYATVTPEIVWKGQFRIPLTGAKTGGNFGKRRVLNGEPSSPHSGVDFPAPTGTPVHAAQRGRVVLAEPLYFSGNTVVVDHGMGIYTFYGHLSAIGVKVGDSVEAGAVLGKVGATGRVTGPHLHWGLEVNRARVNALDIVKLSLRPREAN